MSTDSQSALDDSLPASPAGPLQNWKLTIAYDGTDFHGWQIQPGVPTVQGELQAALGRVTGEAPLPQGSGRTDAGVHALALVASFALRAAIPADNLQRALNRTLRAAVRVVEARRVPAAFHARHSTLAKTYEYRVFPKRTGAPDSQRRDCPPFLARYVLAYPWPLDLARMQVAASLFLGTHDFTSFAATDPEMSRTVEPDALQEDAFPPVNPVRTIFGTQWYQRLTPEGTLLVYQVRGSGFLHHMVRNLVGTMLDMGRGYRAPEQVPSMLAARARAAAGPTAPALGLFLHSVEYPSEAEG